MICRLATTWSSSASFSVSSFAQFILSWWAYLRRPWLGFASSSFKLVSLLPHLEHTSSGFSFWIKLRRWERKSTQSLWSTECNTLLLDVIFCVLSLPFSQLSMQSACAQTTKISNSPSTLLMLQQTFWPITEGSISRLAFSTLCVSLLSWSGSAAAMVYTLKERSRRTLYSLNIEPLISMALTGGSCCSFSLLWFGLRSSSRSWTCSSLCTPLSLITTGKELTSRTE